MLVPRSAGRGRWIWRVGREMYATMLAVKREEDRIEREGGEETRRLHTISGLAWQPG